MKAYLEKLVNANGNLLSDGANTYTYDLANRLTAFNNGTNTYTYAYNGLGDRLQQTVNYTTTTYAIDIAGGLTQVLSDGTYTYLYGMNRISQQHDSVTEYYLDDALGSVRQLTDSGGAVVLARSYDPYGSLVENNAYNGVTTAYGFSGEYTDASGMVYLRARYYNPAQGRFVSRDVWEGDYNSPLSLNRWGYVEGNPINLIDPNGKFGFRVHYELTKQRVQYWERYYGIYVYGLAENIATWDNYVDNMGSILNPGACVQCHFMNKTNTINHINSAIDSKEPFIFGAVLHQFQDYYSHWNEGYENQTLGHGIDSVIAYMRNDTRLKLFFNTYSFDMVSTNIKNRNKSLNISLQRDWDTVDLFLRKENDDPNWNQRVLDRKIFGFRPDLYFETSKREIIMQNEIDPYISEFIYKILKDKCINLYEPSSVREKIAYKYLTGMSLK